jgi:hypothetical protein
LRDDVVKKRILLFLSSLTFGFLVGVGAAERQCVSGQDCEILASFYDDAAPEDFDATSTFADADIEWLCGDAQNTTASQVEQVDGAVFVDQTTNFNDATDNNYVVFPASEATTDYAAFGFPRQFTIITFDYANGTAGTVGTVTWKYWDGSAWTALGGVTDNTTGFTAAVADGLTVTWTMPDDWAPRDLDDGESLFFVIAEITGVYTVNPVLDQGFIGSRAITGVIKTTDMSDGAGALASSGAIDARHVTIQIRGEDITGVTDCLLTFQDQTATKTYMDSSISIEVDNIGLCGPGGTPFTVVADGGNSATQVKTDLRDTDFNTDNFGGAAVPKRAVVFMSGTSEGKASTIQTFNNTTNTLTFTTIGETPSTGDRACIY